MPLGAYDGASAWALVTTPTLIIFSGCVNLLPLEDDWMRVQEADSEACVLYGAGAWGLVRMSHG